MIRAILRFSRRVSAPRWLLLYCSVLATTLYTFTVASCPSAPLRPPLRLIISLTSAWISASAKTVRRWTPSSRRLCHVR